ncbi:MAG: hypothetical protein NVS4B8_07490 [Herpetosiphon sp.]
MLVAAALLGGTILVGLAPADIPRLPTVSPTPVPPFADLQIREEDVALTEPLVEGLPFTVTVDVHNIGTLAVDRTMVLFSVVRPLVSGDQNIFVGAGGDGPIAPDGVVRVPIAIPASVAFTPGEYHYRASAYLLGGQGDAQLHHNVAPIGVFTVAPPYADCSGDPDVAVSRNDIVAEGERMRITVHNLGRKTLYQVPLLVHPVEAGSKLDAFYLLPRILPCGGTTSVTAFRQSRHMEVEVNPAGQRTSFEEQNRLNNRVLVTFP